jgi:hypothetical protein
VKGILKGMKMKRNEKLRMSRQAVAAVCVMLLLVSLPGVASDRAPRSADSSSSAGSSSDRDVTTADLKGITRKHRYIWAMAGGAAVGAGIGALLPPGSGKSAVKGMLIGGSAASFFYLPGHKEAADGYRPLAWIATNSVLGGGIGWTICNCGLGFGVGALIGGGITVITQAVRPRHHRTLTKYTGAQPAPPPQQQQPPVNPPPQQQPQSQPPNPPQANPPQTTPPPDQPPDAPEPKPDR